MPDGASSFRYGSVLFHCLFDNGREVATAAVFHDNVENSSVSVDISVMVSYNVVVVKVLKHVSVSRP
jgi:uncharacterized alkaline shock family protein YloU